MPHTLKIIATFNNDLYIDDIAISKPTKVKRVGKQAKDCVNIPLNTMHNNTQRFAGSESCRKS